MNILWLCSSFSLFLNLSKCSWSAQLKMCFCMYFNFCGIWSCTRHVNSSVTFSKDAVAFKQWLSGVNTHKVYQENISHILTPCSAVQPAQVLTWRLSVFQLYFVWPLKKNQEISKHSNQPASQSGTNNQAMVKIRDPVC